MLFVFLQGPEVRSGDVPSPILLEEGQEFNFTIIRGVSTDNTVSVNYDDFVNDVEAGDMLLVDGKRRCLFGVPFCCDLNHKRTFSYLLLRVLDTDANG